MNQMKINCCDIIIFFFFFFFWNLIRTLNNDITNVVAIIFLNFFVDLYISSECFVCIHYYKTADHCISC